MEPCLREQFETPRPSAVYSAILAALPRVFVGTEARLATLVTWLSARLRDAFEAADMALPPWRARVCLLAKWRLHELDAAATTTAAHEEALSSCGVVRRVAPQPLLLPRNAAQGGGGAGGVVIMQQRNGLTFTARVAACTPPPCLRQW